MGKHRRPPARRTPRRSLQLGIALGIAGAVTVSASLLAAASPSGSTAADITTATSPIDDAAFRRSLHAATESSGAKAAAAGARRDAPRSSRGKRAAARPAPAVAATESVGDRAQVDDRKQAEKKRAADQAKAARAKKKASRSHRMSAGASTVLQIAAAQQGDRYSRGGDGPDAFDCSGFTQYVFAQVGIDLPHSSSAQRGVARRVSASEVQPGDLVFVYNGGGGTIGHVAIYGGPGVWYEAQGYGRPVGRKSAWSSNVSYGRVL